MTVEPSLYTYKKENNLEKEQLLNIIEVIRSSTTSAKMISIRKVRGRPIVKEKINTKIIR